MSDQTSLLEDAEPDRTDSASEPARIARFERGDLFVALETDRNIVVGRAWQHGLSEDGVLTLTVDEARWLTLVAIPAALAAPPTGGS